MFEILLDLLYHTIPYKLLIIFTIMWSHHHHNLIFDNFLAFRAFTLYHCYLVILNEEEKLTSVIILSVISSQSSSVKCTWNICAESLCVYRLWWWDLLRYTEGGGVFVDGWVTHFHQEIICWKINTGNAQWRRYKW